MPLGIEIRHTQISRSPPRSGADRPVCARASHHPQPGAVITGCTRTALLTWAPGASQQPRRSRHGRWPSIIPPPPPCLITQSHRGCFELFAVRRGVSPAPPLPHPGNVEEQNAVCARSFEQPAPVCCVRPGCVRASAAAYSDRQCISIYRDRPYLTLRGLRALQLSGIEPSRQTVAPCLRSYPHP